MRKDINRAAQNKLCDDLLAEFSIGHIETSLGQALSGGERRRVEIARALALDPAFVLLDEPFAGVDPISINEIKGIVNQLKDRGIGVLITDHNVRETLDICERAYIVGEGYVIASGEPEKVLADEKVKAVYLGDDFTL
jgi:lipopolysaccharide export system ATP-binding protein